MITFIALSAWYFAAVFTIVSALLPIISANAWWIRWFDFPRLQFLVLGIIVLGLQFLWKPGATRIHAAIMVALIAVNCYQGYKIFPYTRLSAEQVTRATKEENGVVIDIVTANVLMHNRMAEKFLAILNEIDPDIILTTEADQWWAEQLQVLDKAYPHHIKYPLDNTYGMILQSKFPLTNSSVEFLIEPRVPSIHTDVRLPDGQVFRLIGLHPKPPLPDHDSTARDAELISVAKSSKQLQLPVMVLGDLNDVAWSHTTSLFQKIGGMLDPRIGRGMYNTFHAQYFFIRFPLDHIFHSSHFNYVDMQRLPPIGSDHFPLYVALSLEPEKDASHKEPAAPSAEEKEEAEEIRHEPFDQDKQ